MGPGIELAILGIAAGAGVLGGMVGLGGAVFMVPIFSTLLGIPIKAAIAASALAVIVNSVGSAAVYLEDRMVNLRLGLLLLTAAAAGAIAGALLVTGAPTNLLRVVFAFTLLGMVILLNLHRAGAKFIRTDTDRWGFASTFLDPAEGREVKYVPQHIALGTVVSIGAGVLSGLLGVGGGFMQVPMMNILMRVPVKAAAATSSFMTGATVVGSVLLYYANGLMSPQVAIPAALGIFLGSQVGPRIGRRVRGYWIRRVLSLILLYLAASLLLQALGISLLGTR